MAVEVFFLHPQKLVVEVYFDVITYADMQASFKNPGFLEAAENWGADLRHMVITQKDADTKVTQEQLIQLSERPPVLHIDARRVFVSQGDLVFGMTRQFVAYRGKQAKHLTAVRDISEALEFLGLPLCPLSEELDRLLAPFKHPS